MRYLVDAQLPPALARFLTAKGEDAVHVLDVEMMESSDSEIWDFAIHEEMVIITKDEDFQVRASVTQHRPVIIWVRIGNCSKKMSMNDHLPSFFGRSIPTRSAHCHKMLRFNR